MVTAAGFNARSTCAAVRAGVSGIRKDKIWDLETGEPISAGRPRTHHWWPGPEMLAELAASAINECLCAAPKIELERGIPFFVLLSPLDRPHRESDLANTVLAGIQHRLPDSIHGGMTAFAAGRTGIWHAVRKASELFSSKSATYAVIVGADSFVRQPVIETYTDERRILTPGNSNGFIPGEAACAVLVTTASQRSEPELRLIGWGEGRESGTIGSEKPLTGEGLCTSIREALKVAELRWADTQYWLTDQNAEHYKAKECTIAQIRLERRDKPAAKPFEIWHPIEYLGEIGSAIGPCLLGLARAAAEGSYSPGPLALMSVGEDSGERASFVLRWNPSN